MYVTCNVVKEKHNNLLEVFIFQSVQSVLRSVVKDEQVTEELNDERENEQFLDQV